MSDLDVAAIKEAHTPAASGIGRRNPEAADHCPACSEEASNWIGATTRRPCLVYRLAVELERAQAASEGVDMLVAQAERRGAVKALRAAAEKWRNATGNARTFSVAVTEWLDDRASKTEAGADL